MLCAQFYAWKTNENKEYTNEPDHSLMLNLVKVPCIVALHFVLTPDVDNSLKIMKFANNQAHQFVRNGSEIVFMLGLVQSLISVFNLAIGVILLTFQHSINHAIVHFIALHVVNEVAEFYYESLAANNHLMHNFSQYYPHVETKGSDIKFSERSCFHKLARVIYRTFRLGYVSIVFYFVPFLPFII